MGSAAGQPNYGIFQVIKSRNSYNVQSVETKQK